MAADGVAGVFVVLGLVCAAASWLRWTRAERAMRLNNPLPASRFSVLLSAVVVLSAVALLAFGLWQTWT